MKSWLLGLIFITVLILFGQGENPPMYVEVGKMRLSSPHVPTVPGILASQNIVTDGYYDFGRRGMVVCDSQDEFLSLFDGQGLLGVPQVDFSSHMAVLVAYGQAAGGGRSVEIQHVYRVQSTLVIKARFVKPPSDIVVTEAIEYPFTTLAIPRSLGINRLVLEDESGSAVDLVNL